MLDFYMVDFFMVDFYIVDFYKVDFYKVDFYTVEFYTVDFYMVNLKKKRFKDKWTLFSNVFFFQTKKSLGILEMDDWKKEYVKKIKLKKICAQEQ